MVVPSFLLNFIRYIRDHGVEYAGETTVKTSQLLVIPRDGDLASHLQFLCSLRYRNQSSFWESKSSNSLWMRWRALLLAFLGSLKQYLF